MREVTYSLKWKTKIRSGVSVVSARFDKGIIDTKDAYNRARFYAMVDISEEEEKSFEVISFDRDL